MGAVTRVPLSSAKLNGVRPGGTISTNVGGWHEEGMIKLPIDDVESGKTIRESIFHQGSRMSPELDSDSAACSGLNMNLDLDM
jgi:hypothetical protein